MWGYMDKMAHRYTIKELKEKSELEILYLIVNDRYSQTKNRYSPLSEYLSKLLNKISTMIDNGAKEL